MIAQKVVAFRVCPLALFTPHKRYNKIMPATMNAKDIATKNIVIFAVLTLGSESVLIFLETASNQLTQW